MNLRDHRGAFADRGGDALGRAGPNIADREDARQAGFERQPDAVALRRAGDDEALLVDLDAAMQPIGIGVGADEEEQVPQRMFDFITARAVAEGGAG